MTENEAVERIKEMYFMCDDFYNCKYGHDCTDGCSEAVKMAVDALQGSIKKHIGKDNMVISSSDLMTILNSDSEELKQYKEVGTVEECRVAVEKMKPKKAKGLRICNQACCPNCNTVVLDDEFWMLDEYTYYCDSCGQAVKGIDWSE